MATFTITTAVNIDTLAAKAGNDVYNINGGYLTVDQDSRYGTNQNTSASIGNVTLSATLGGTIEFNGTLVRIIPYNTGTGNVPALDTAITKGGASGKLIGVYSALNVAPTAAGAAMPASGYIKIRQWNSVAYAAGALTGIGATATGLDRVGWLDIIGAESATVTVNRLNTFKTRGDWFVLGTTDGTRATTYQIPSNGTNVYHPGVWVETAAGSGSYEFYPCAGSVQAATAATFATDEVRGRWCWISAAGLLRFGHDGTNSTGGFCPETGRAIRMPNVFFSNATVAAPTVTVLPAASIGTRQEFLTTGGGVIDLEFCSMSWYLNVAQAYSLNMTNCGHMTRIDVSEIATAMTWSQVGIGQPDGSSDTALVMGLCLAGGTFSYCTFTRISLVSSGFYVITLTDSLNLVFTNLRLHAMTSRGNATTGVALMTRVNDSSFQSSTFGGGMMSVTTSNDLSFKDSIYYDGPAVNTIATNPVYMFSLVAVARCRIDGVTFGGLYMKQPYNGILSVGTGCSVIKLRNLGTSASPLSFGSPRVNDAAWTRVTTTATVTSTAHGLAVNDTIYVVVSSVTAAITVAAKTVTAVTANTFTFACTNAGAASGTLSYYGTKAANLLVFGTGAAGRDVQVKRAYVPHTRTGLYTGDNSSKGVIFESVYSDYINVFVVPMLNCWLRGVSGVPSFAAQTSCYGTHWLDGYTADLPTSTAAQAWSRSTTTITVTSTGHNLRTGLEVIVTVCSDTSALRLGRYTVTVIDSSTFTVTGINAGAASGTLTYDPLVGRLALLMNEQSLGTAGTYVVDSGGPTFTSAGGLVMATVGDRITFEKQEALLGVTAFPIAEATMAGGTISNYEITYSIGSIDGTFGAYHNLYYPRAGGGGSNGATTITMTSTTGVEAGDYVWGTNVGPNTKVVSVDNGTTCTVTNANIGAVSGVLRFGHLPSETPPAADVGFLIKWRIKTATASASAITSLYAFIASTSTSRAYQYPLDPVTVQVTCYNASTGLPVQNARVYLEATNSGPAADGTVIMSSLTDASGIASLTYAYTGDQDVIGYARKGTSAPRFKEGIASGTITETGLDASVFLVADE